MIKNMFKQVILVRQDLNMPKGKLAAQVSHASLEAAYRSDQGIVDQWRQTGVKKVVLKVVGKKELFDYIKRAKRHNLTTVVIRDAGKTFLIPGTITCGAIGPDEEEKVSEITADLKLL